MTSKLLFKLRSSAMASLVSVEKTGLYEKKWVGLPILRSSRDLIASQSLLKKCVLSSMSSTSGFL